MYGSAPAKIVDVKQSSPRTGADHAAVLLKHLEHIVSCQDERKALLDLRRIGCWFLRGAVGMKALREAINKSPSVAEIRGLIQSYPWDEMNS